MFQRKTLKINPETTDTLVGEGTIVEGKINTEASLRIEGMVHGDITSSGDVTIGENGIVQSDITARNVINAGTVLGSIHTKGKLVITSTGKVQGSITVQSLSIAEGGVFQGTSRMETKAQTEHHQEKNSEAIPLKKPKEGKTSAAV